MRGKGFKINFLIIRYPVVLALFGESLSFSCWKSIEITPNLFLNFLLCFIKQACWDFYWDCVESKFIENWSFIFWISLILKKFFFIEFTSDEWQMALGFSLCKKFSVTNSISLIDTRLFRFLVSCISFHIICVFKWFFGGFISAKSVFLSPFFIVVPQRILFRLLFPSHPMNF